MTSSQQFIDKYLKRAPHSGSHWHSCKLMFCTTPIDMMPIYPRQIQHPILDLKMKLLVKIVKLTLNCKLFSQKDAF